MKFGPVPVGLDDIPWYILLPFVLDALAVVEVKLAIDNLPCLRIDRRRPALADRIGHYAPLQQSNCLDA